MFSYSKPIINNPNNQNYLISEIQAYGSQIFKDHTTSKTDHQQMSLELSPTTSEQYEEGYVDKQNQQQNVFQKIITPFKKNEQTFTFKQISNNGNKPVNSDINRMSKSVITQSISKNNIFKQNDLKKIKNDKFNQQLQHDKEMSLAHQILKRSNINLTDSSNRKNDKTSHKKFSNYASNYLSPYSSKSFKINSKSYMQKSHSKSKNHTKEYEYIKQKINENIEPHISYRKQKQSIDRSRQQKMKNVKSKYRQSKPPLGDYKIYANENIYKKMKTEMGHFQDKKKVYSTISPEQLQMNWQNFIEREQNFKQQKQQKILRKQLEHCQKENSLTNLKKSRNKSSEKTPQKMSAEFYIKKIKRQKDKLKERLELNEIHNFMQRSFDDQKRFGREVYNNIFGIKTLKDEQSLAGVEQFSTIKQQTQSKQLSNSIISHAKNKLFNENFFKSIEDNSESFQPFHSDSDFKNDNMTKSLFFESIRKKQNSKDFQMKKSKKIANFNTINFEKKSKNSQKSSSKKNGSPFSKKNKEKISTTGCNSERKNNSSTNNYKHINIKQRILKFKQQNTSLSGISQLLNPKYFKSINQLEQYSTNSKQKLQKKTYNFSSSINPGNRANIPSYQRNIISNFDQNLMRKTIQDIQKNLRSYRQVRQPRLKNSLENYNNINKTITDRKNQRFFKQSDYYFDENEKNLSQNKQKQRSVSPIFQQNSISNIQMYGITNDKINKYDNLKSRIQSQKSHEKTLSNSLIMVKNPQEIEFILESSKKRNKYNREDSIGSERQNYRSSKSHKKSLRIDTKPSYFKGTVN